MIARYWLRFLFVLPINRGTVQPENKRPPVRRFLEELPISVSVCNKRRYHPVINISGALFALLWMEGKFDCVRGYTEADGVYARLC